MDLVYRCKVKCRLITTQADFTAEDVSHARGGQKKKNVEENFKKGQKKTPVISAKHKALVLGSSHGVRRPVWNAVRVQSEYSLSETYRTTQKAQGHTFRLFFCSPDK